MIAKSKGSVDVPTPVPNRNGIIYGWYGENLSFWLIDHYDGPKRFNGFGRLKRNPYLRPGELVQSYP